MSIKSFLIILVLSVVVTYGASIVIDLLKGGSVIAGPGGFPFVFTSGGGLLSTPTTNYPMLILDIVFWFVMIFIIWKLVFKR